MASWLTRPTAVAAAAVLSLALAACGSGDNASDADRVPGRTVTTTLTLTVAGFTFSNVAPESASTSRPSMSIRVSGSTFGVSVTQSPWVPHASRITCFLVGRRYLNLTSQSKSEVDVVFKFEYRLRHGSHV